MTRGWDARRLSRSPCHPGYQAVTEPVHAELPNMQPPNYFHGAVLREKLIVAELVEKLITFYGIRRSIRRHESETSTPNSARQYLRNTNFNIIF
jgi:hypothetical protein